MSILSDFSLRQLYSLSFRARLKRRSRSATPASAAKQQALEGEKEALQRELLEAREGEQALREQRAAESEEQRHRHDEELAHREGLEADEEDLIGALLRHQALGDKGRAGAAQRAAGEAVHEGEQEEQRQRPPLREAQLPLVLRHLRAALLRVLVRRGVRSVDAQPVPLEAILVHLLPRLAQRL